MSAEIELRPRRLRREGARWEEQDVEQGTIARRLREQVEASGCYGVVGAAIEGRHGEVVGALADVTESLGRAAGRLAAALTLTAADFEQTDGWVADAMRALEIP